jgi:hypothetical protein
MDVELAQPVGAVLQGLMVGTKPCSQASAPSEGTRSKMDKENRIPESEHDTEWKTPETGRQWQNQQMFRENCQPGILYLAKLCLKNEKNQQKLESLPKADTLSQHV